MLTSDINKWGDSMHNGFNGKVLFVDLTSGLVKEESLPEQIYRDYIGGQGLGVRILYERIKPKADPLGPDNMLGFLPGLLTGVGVHGARYQVVAKSPVTGGWGDSNSGGSFSIDLKASGYDGVFFTGISPKPVYLFLNVEKAELKDASHLWGRRTGETEELIREELDDEKVKVACIGPAGEREALSAAIMHEGSACARGGIGAVMGSKNLKAFAVRGTRKIDVADPKELAKLRKDYLTRIKLTQHPFVSMLRQWGTCSFVTPSVTGGDVPIKNWTAFGEESFPNHDKINGDEITKYQVKRCACVGCPIGCKGRIKIEESPYGKIETAKLEYETLGMLGGNCLVDDVEAIAKVNEICNDYGFDTITIGAAIAFAMECYERGVITREDIGGIELTWGNGAAMIALAEMIARGEGLGVELANGSMFAAKKIGKGSEEWAIHVAGQDIPSHVPTATTGHAWGYVVEPTAARHTNTHIKHSHDCRAPGFFYSDHFPETDPLDVAANAPYFALASDLERLWTSAGMCCFAIWGGDFPLFEVIRAVTGWDYSDEEGIKMGRRVQTLRQAFNIREGVDTSSWRLPKRATVAPSGPNKNRKIDFDAMKEEGYKALGWDPKTGIPLESTIEGLGLKKLVT